MIDDLVTRGVAERDFAYPKDTPTTLLAFTQAASLVDNPKAETGVDAISVPDIRWRRRDINSIALLPQCMGKEQAALAVAYAALGVPAGIAMMAVLAYRLLSYWLPVGVGLVPGLKMLRSAPGLQTAYPQRLAA